MKNIFTHLLLTGLLFLFTDTSSAQKVFSVQYKSDAQVKVYVAQYASDAQKKIFFCDYASDASWKNNSKKQLMY